MYIGLQKIKDVIDYIEDNITADLDCKTLSSKMGLSVYEFRRIFSFEENGVIDQYEGGYTDYINRKKEKRLLEENALLKTKSSSAGKSDSDKTEKEEYKIRNKKLKFSYNEQREYETIEDDIAKLEEKIEKLDGEIVKNATNSVKLRELMESKEETETLLMEKMDRWEYLEDLAKKIEEQ